MGSNRHEALDDFLIIDVISVTEVGVKDCNVEEEGCSNVLIEGQVIVRVELSKSDRDVRILVILVTKNSLNVRAIIL